MEMNITLKETRQDGVSGGLLKIVADGYNAPVTAGNFIDLVQRGFYNNMEIQRSDGFVVQTGDPGPEQVGDVCLWSDPCHIKLCHWLRDSDLKPS